MHATGGGWGANRDISGLPLEACAAIEAEAARRGRDRDVLVAQLVPVVGIALQDDAAALHPLLEDERAGSDGLFRPFVNLLPIACFAYGSSARRRRGVGSPLHRIERRAMDTQVSVRRNA